METKDKTTDKAATADAEVKDKTADKGKVTVRLVKDAENYKDDVFICVNGRAIKVKRGVNVEIPQAHAEVLKNSMDQDGRTAELITQRAGEFESNKKSVGL